LEVCQRIKLLRGVRAKQIDQVEDLDQLSLVTEKLLTGLGWVQKGDLICILAGTPFQIPGRTDVIKLLRIGE
jgi:pyruvate kinase